MKSFKIQTHIDLYRTFFDHDWARRFDELVRESRLREPGFSLCVSWKSAANSHAMPWLMVGSLAGFMHGFTASDQSVVGRTIWHMAKTVPAAMAAHLTNTTRKKLAELMAAIGNHWKAHQIRENSGLNPQELFEKLLFGDGGSELQLSIKGTQRMVYSAVFHAYENFITQTIGLVQSEPNYRGHRFKDLFDHAKESFGTATAEYCLGDDFVDAGRLVRNALAHNGGRITEKLAKVDHQIDVVDGELQITPVENKRLLDGLMARAYTFASGAIALPKIQ